MSTGHLRVLEPGQLGPYGGDRVAVVSAELAPGSHTVALLILDDHAPPNTLMDVHTLAVVPPTAVPGISARYFDSGAADPATLLANPPATADWAEIRPTLEVGDGQADAVVSMMEAARL